MQELELVPYLLYEKEDTGILWIKFNRPEKLNAAVGGSERTGTLSKVGEYMRAGDDDPDVKVIVLTGVGRGFCAGVDVSGADTGSFEAGDNFLGNAPAPEGVDASREHFYYGITKLMKDISFIRKPTIAMLNGVAAGFGMGMSLQCDIRYGCENTRFISYQQVGQIIENGGAYYLPRLAGLGRALEFSFTGHLEEDDCGGGVCTGGGCHCGGVWVYFALAVFSRCVLPPSRQRVSASVPLTSRGALHSAHSMITASLLLQREATERASRCRQERGRPRNWACGPSSPAT